MRTFGKYTLLEPLASGGMADVFRAEVAGAAGVTKEVALKLVRGEHGGDSEFVRMFIQEARLASRLTHANVVQVFEFDQVDGRHYIAMELVWGRNLARVVDRCREQGVRFGLARAVHVGAEAAKGLAYAHRLAGPDGTLLGLVHRDVSPHNLLVSFEGEVKVADFGIARAMNRAGLTEPGTLKGKIAYMAPEQARGDPVDARADVFSLGVVLWELCTGRRLFARDSDAATLAALLGPDPVSATSGWNEAIPPELDAVLQGALEKDPARRTGSADELARALSRILLRLASSPEDWDLRILMHRLWPAEARSPPPAAPEATRVRQAPVPAAAPRPVARDAEDSTRTAPPAPGARRLRVTWAVAAVVAAAVAGLALSLRGAGTREAAPPSPATSPAIATPPPTAPAIATPPPTATAPATPASTPPAKARPPRITSQPGAWSLSLPPRSSGEGLVFVNATPWADLMVDGVAVGEAPRTVRLPAGRHRFRVRHPTYGQQETVIEVRAGERSSWAPGLMR